MFEFGRLIRSRMSAHPSPSLPQLAAHLKVKAPSATALVAELARAGLITRSTGADRREVMLVLTAKGTKVLRTSVARRAKIIHDILLPLPARDRKAFDRILRTIICSNR